MLEISKPIFLFLIFPLCNQKIKRGVSPTLISSEDKRRQHNNDFDVNDKNHQDKFRNLLQCLHVMSRYFENNALPGLNMLKHVTSVQASARPVYSTETVQCDVCSNSVSSANIQASTLAGPSDCTILAQTDTTLVQSVTCNL